MGIVNGSSRYQVWCLGVLCSVVLVRRTRLPTNARDKAADTLPDAFEFVVRSARRIDHGIDRFIAVIQDVDFFLTECSAEPNADIGVDPSEIHRALVELHDCIIPDGNHFLLLSELLNDCADAAVRHAKLALCGDIIAPVDGPEDRNRSERKGCRGDEQNRQNDAAEERRARTMNGKN